MILEYHSFSQILENVAKAKETKTVWNTIYVPNPSAYIHVGLYFTGHRHSDNILENMPQFYSAPRNETDDLAEKFENFITPPPKPIIPDFKKVNTPIEEGELKQTPPRDETAPHTYANVEV